MKMFKNLKIWALAAIVAFASTACSSSDEDNGKPVPDGKKTTVKLNLSLAPAAAASTVNNVWVLQWDNAGNNKVCYKERYHDTTTPLEASLVSGNGTKVAVIAGVGDGTVYQLGTSYADFCKKAYAERITNDAQIPYSGLQEVTVSKEGQSIDVPLKWVAAKVSFRIAAPASGYTLKSAQVKNIASTIYLLPGSTTEATFTSGDIALTDLDQTFTYYMAENMQGTESGITSATDRITKKKATYVEVIATKTANNKRTTATFVSFYGNNSTDNFDVNRGNIYAQELTIDFDAENDKRVSRTEADAALNLAVPANSYILSPTETIPLGIPVSRVNDFWVNVYDDPRYAIDNGVNDGAVTKWVAKVIWETTPNLISFQISEGTDANGHIVIRPGSAATSGNVLIGIFDASKSTDIDPTTAKALWSWHIWVTTYNPGGDANGIIPTVSGDPGRTAVANGYVHYFESLSANKTVDGSQAVIMDRDLGALASDPTNLRISSGLFYQWGRKDPFYAKLPDDSVIPPDGYPIGPEGAVIGATDHIAREIGPISFAKAIQNPTLFVMAETLAEPAGFDWLQSGNNNDELWYNSLRETEKTLFDPCPPGWRIPHDTKTFESLVPREVWEPSWFDPSNPGDKADEWGYYTSFPRQGVVCWDDQTQFYSNNSGRINCFNGKLFEYGSAQYMILGVPLPKSKKDVHTLYQHSLMGVNSKDGSMNLIEPAYYTTRTSGSNVRCVKE